jgi:hypothetical protein
MRHFAGLAAALAASLAILDAQVIEFESGGLRYLTQTRQGLTVMVANLHPGVGDYSILQVAVSNGSAQSWTIKPEDFVFQRSDGVTIRAAEARTVVNHFMQRGGRDDVVKLVSTYESGLYGIGRLPSTNGYESRRQSELAEVSSTRFKAAAAASAIVLVPVKLKPGESTDGAVFYETANRFPGLGKLLIKVAGTNFEFEARLQEEPKTQTVR